MRKLVVVVLASALVAACSSGGGATNAPASKSVGATQSAKAPGGGGPAGAGTVVMKMGGKTMTVTGAVCNDYGESGVEVRAGAYGPDKSQPNGVIMLLPRSKSGNEAISGRFDGQDFVLAAETTSTVNSDLSGSFSGKDMATSQMMEATFACK